MVIVTATQELKAGDFLLQFKAEAFQDDIHGIRSTSVRPVLHILIFFFTHGILFTCISFFSSFVVVVVVVGSRVLFSF